MPELTEQTLYQSLAQANWHAEGLVQRLNPPRSLRSWLTDRGSLTKKLRQLCPSLAVRVLHEQHHSPMRQEALALQMPLNRDCWIRTVQLHCHGHPWVYARTVIPNLTPRNPWYALKQLGNQPLGDVLFNTPHLARSQFCLAAVGTRHFARQSIFFNKNTPLLLTEVLTETLALRLAVNA